MTIKLSSEEIDTIASIISNQECRLDFKCYKSGFEDICGAVLDSDGKAIECIEENAKNCSHSSPFGTSFLCTCPMRSYIARHFHK